MERTLKPHWKKHETPVLNKRKFSQEAGFSLLEMLVVVSLLAATAYVATGAYTGFIEDSQEQMVYSEMQEIAAAIRQFKQDTGYYPKTGPFDLQLLGTDPGSVEKNCLPDYIKASVPDNLSDNEIRRWFYSPANLYQLTSQNSPLECTNHQLEDWDEESGRGWRGPYLRGFRDGYVDIRDNINSSLVASEIAKRAEGDVSGNPLEGKDIPDVTGLADPFIDSFENVVGGSLLDWSRTRRRLSTDDADEQTGRDEIEKWGRPYLVFDWNSSPHLMSMGPDGVFDSGTNDDIVLQLSE